MLSLRFAALSLLALPAALAFELLPDQCGSLGDHIVAPAADARITRDQPFPVEFCSTTKNTQSIIVSLVSADGTAQATSKQLTDVVKPRGEYLEKRYYERTLVLRSDETPAGQYSLVVDETYSPNDDIFLANRYNISITVA